MNAPEALTLLPDPQTNGGILISVNERAVEELKLIFKKYGLENFAEPIGRMIRHEKLINVK